jgi:hypothetical protein
VLCGHLAHDAENGTACRTAECLCPAVLPASGKEEETLSGMDLPRSQPLVKSKRQHALESLTPPPVKFDAKKIAAMQRQQMIRIFAGGIVVLLLLAGVLVCWRMM